MNLNASVQFFEAQFQRQAQGEERVLNRFEQAALPHLQGQVLDFGCGMGALAVALAERGCSVLALDASPTAIAQLQALARERGLAIQAWEADLRCYEIQREFDAAACICLLMFFDRESALRQLAALQRQLRAGGLAAIHVLIEGTTYNDMFDPACHCLLTSGELAAQFAGWPLLHHQVQDFAAPGGRIKRFATAVARKPGAAGVWSTRAAPMPTRAAVPRRGRGLREPMAPMAAVPQNG